MPEVAELECCAKCGAAWGCLFSEECPCHKATSLKGPLVELESIERKFVAHGWESLTPQERSTLCVGGGREPLQEKAPSLRHDPLAGLLLAPFLDPPNPYEFDADPDGGSF